MVEWTVCGYVDVAFFGGWRVEKVNYVDFLVGWMDGWHNGRLSSWVDAGHDWLLELDDGMDWMELISVISSLINL